MNKFLKILFITMIIFLLIMSGIIINKNIIKNTSDKIAEKEEVNGIDFDVYSNENNKLMILVKAYDEENGIKELKYNIDGKEKIINSGSKRQVAIDFIVDKDGEYKFIAISGNGKTMEKTLEIDEEYKNHLIDIEISNENEYETEKEITIDYKKYNNRQYKIGEKSGNWTNYENSFKVNSYDILSKSLENEDKTLNIYAKSEDKAGNKVIITKKFVTLDLDMPNKPKIKTVKSDDYARIEDGKFKINSEIEIEFDNRQDVKNYYSTNYGITWNEYNGKFTTDVINVLAKTIKTVSGLTIENNEYIKPSADDAITYEAYDNNTNTIFTTNDFKYININENSIGKEITFYMRRGNSGFNQYINFIDSNGTILQSYEYNGGGEEKNYIYNIPEGTVKIAYKGNTENYYTGWAGANHYWAQLVEISVDNKPQINVEQIYAKLHLDNTVDKPYYNISINYDNWCVKKQYKIDDGDWKEYSEMLKIIDGQHKIYAKGIYENNTETSVSEYNCDFKNYIEENGYDDNDSTYVTADETKYIFIDSNLIGKNISFKIERGNTNFDQYIYFYNNNELISDYKITATGTYEYLIPEGTTKIGYKGSSQNYTSGWAGINSHYARLIDLKIINE